MAYRLYLAPDYDRDHVLMELLTTRHKLAVTCGFPSYSHKVLKGGILSTPELVIEFLDKLSNSIKHRAEEEFALLNKMKQHEISNSEPLAMWDILYYTQQFKRNNFKVTTEEYAPYFSLGCCIEGLSNLFNSLYGITLKNDLIQFGEIWTEDTYKLAVKHESEGLLGYIYCDFFRREDKISQDCHISIRGGKILQDGSYQLPIAAVILNFPKPTGCQPLLLAPLMVENLFHEMGHAMHSMLARTRYQHVSGTRCSTDIAEMPSVLMEYFANDPRVLKSFARHFQTNEVISDEMIQRLCASKNTFVASETQQQIFYSALDQIFHGVHPLKGTMTDVIASVQDQYYNVPYVPNTSWQLRFNHLFGYGAKYYSYLVCKALSASIWQLYFEKDPFSRIEGDRLRRECLAHGGGKPSSKIIADYIHHDPNPDVLCKFITNEIDNKHELWNLNNYN